MTHSLWSRRDLLALSCTAVAAPALAAGFTPSPTRIPVGVIKSLDHYVPRYLQVMGAPGMALAVTTADSSYVNTYGVADLAARTGIPPTARFQIGSISKSFCALALLQMQDEGKLHVDDFVLSHLPWLPIEQPYGGVTLHHLLTHTISARHPLPLLELGFRSSRPRAAPARHASLGRRHRRRGACAIGEQLFAER